MYCKLKIDLTNKIRALEHNDYSNWVSFIITNQMMGELIVRKLLTYYCSSPPFGSKRLSNFVC